jgi:DNA polymerase elongation subunit (family B)
MLLRVVDCWYTRVDAGYRESMPMIHLVGRDQQLQRHHVRVEGYRPYFVVGCSEWQRRGEDVAADNRVLDVQTTDSQGRTEQTLANETAVRVVCRDPSDVADLCELFDDPCEADVSFPTRFLIDHDVAQWIEITETDFSTPVSVDAVCVGVDDPPAETPPLRTCTYDIEVEQGGSGPPIVSKEGTEQTRNPITAITAHDSYTNEYRVWVLLHGDWDASDSQRAREAVEYNVSVYASPRDVVGQFCEWVVERGFDALTGWNCSGFDHPYLVNWALQNGVNSVYDLSPTGDVYQMDGNGSWINSSLQGRLLLDLMEMYEKTQIHSLDSKRLADVAEAEDVSVGKLAIEDEIDVPDDATAIDYAWANHPETFVEYSLRDVQAAVGINRESQQEVNIL